MTVPPATPPRPRAALPPADWALGLALASLTLATRWPYRARLLPTWDAVQFALALERYDVVRHQPHPPGYILYVALAYLAEPVLGDPAATLGGLAVVASATAVLLLYQLGWHLYGRRAALLAAVGLVVSPLFWAYGVVGLSYTAEAALSTGLALGAWAMGRGSVPALVGSAVLLGLAGGVRQSMLLLLGPLWLGMAWRGFRRPGPLLGGVGLVLLTVAAWLGPMLWLTGVDRYVSATLELYESTVRATTLLGGGWPRNVVGLGEALVVGLGLLLPVVAWNLRGAAGRIRAGGDRAVLLALWVLPPLAVYVFVHLGQHGYLLTLLPACYLLGGRTLAALWPSGPLGTPAARWQAAAASAIVVGGFGAHALFFTAAGPVDVWSPPVDATWRERTTAELRALYRYRLWAHTAAGLREQEAVIGDYVTTIRRRFDPRDTVLVTELGNPRSYPWFRHVMYYLPEYAVYHLRLGEAGPGYLRSRELPSMAAVANWRVPLPPATHRVVWVVDEWHPSLPRPAAVEALPLSHGRWLYVERVRPGGVEHAGYRLVPVTVTAEVRLR